MFRLMSAITSRNAAETDVPMKLPTALVASNQPRIPPAARAMPIDARTTTVEWPSEK